MLRRRRVHAVVATLIAISLLAPAAGADPDDPDPSDLQGPAENVVETQAAHDAVLAGIISDGPDAKVTKNLDPVGRGIRNELGVTTDVWAYENYAYTGTFSTLCSTGNNDSGVWVWKTNNVNKPSLTTVIDTAAGSKTNDVKVATMNSGDILVMSNETCGPGGPGGFDIYDVDDPKNPVFQSRVQTDDVNIFLMDVLGFVDFGVHNLFLFTQGDRDYVAAVVESEFGNFQVFDITDPANPTLAGFWGAEQLAFPGIDWVNLNNFATILAVDAYLFSGFGGSQNRFLHDITVTPDGTQAYLSNWDAGLVLLDISDVSDPQVVSVALDPVNGSPLDGEVNSHSAWPNEDGTIVVEGEEDFNAWEATVPPGNLTLDSPIPGDPTIPGTAISTTAGDDFEGSQTGSTGTVDGSSVAVTGGPLAGNTYPAAELATAAGSPTFADTGPLTGELVWIGRGCTGDPVLNPGAVDPGDIAVVRRGACFFEDKANTAAGLGAAAVVIANNNPASTPWSGLRIWDYSDPANPVLASTFDTTCSISTAPGGDCDPAGTYSSHNVIVETLGNKVKAYVSWYNDGMLVLDVTDPYNPVELARFVGTNEVGDPTDFWGVYKIPNNPYVYAADRNGGLWIFKEKGAGSGG